MARKKRGFMGYAVVLVILALAAFGGYMLLTDTPTGQKAIESAKAGAEAARQAW